MNLIKVHDVVINLDSVADAQYDPAAEQAGTGVSIPPASLLTIRHVGIAPGGQLMTRKYHGGDADAIWSYLAGLCASRHPA